MGFYFANPSAILSPYIKNYWAIENCLNYGEEHIQRIVPNGMISLSFYLSDRPELLNHHQRAMESSSVNGHCKGFYDLSITGNLNMFSVSFKPEGASMFFDLPMNELFNCIIPARYLIKEEIDRLETDLFDSQTFSDKVRLVETFLVERFHKKSKSRYEQQIIGSIRLIDKNKGNIGVESLASEACLSKKQFERIFQEYVGTSPKQFMRVVRFQNALYCRSKNSQLSLTELAYECGFFDQSHLITDFRDLSGKTPKQYFAECKPVSDYFDL